MKLRPAWGKGPVWQSGRAHRVVRIGWTSVRKLTVRPSRVEVVVVEGVPGVVVLEEVLPAVVVRVVTVVVVVVVLPGLVSVATRTVVKPSIDASRAASSPVIAHPLLPSAVR